VDQYGPKVIVRKVISKPNVIGRCGLTDRMSFSLCVLPGHHRWVYCYQNHFAQNVCDMVVSYYYDYYDYYFFNYDAVSSSIYTETNSTITIRVKVKGSGGGN